jgi:uncharacterized protein involved in exopolysaccharide biosynthesis
MKNQEISPRETLEIVFRRWWFIILMTVLGGLAGWSFHFFNPPVYEATSLVTVNMDFQKRELTQYEEDYAFDSAGGISMGDDVENRVVAEAKIRGLSIELNQLKQQMFIERKQSLFELHIRNQDPQIAAQLANIWAEKFYEALNEALGHAIRADQIQAQIDAINGNLPATGSPVLSPEAQTTLKTLSDELLQEQQSSQGIISIMKFAITGSASVPSKPVLNYLASLVLAGASIGFIVSLWVVNSFKVQRHA